MEESSRSALQQSPGQFLRSVEGLFFVRLGASTFSLDNLHQLRITLDSNSVRFRCSSDGETLTVDLDGLCPSDLGEYGELRRADLSQDPMFRSLTNTQLRQVSLLKSYGKKYTIGVGLEFAGGSLVICNWGDELKVWKTVPDSLFANEGIDIVPV